MLRKAICLLVPISIAVQIDVGSRVYAAEIALPCLAAVILLSQRSWGDTRYFMALAKVGAAFLFMQIFSDIWNETSFDQYSRGWSRITIFIVNLISIYIIVGNSRSNIILFALGFSLGRIVITLSGLEDDVIPWKIGLAKPAALLLILSLIIVTKRTGRKELIAGSMLIALGLFDITMDFRSHGFVLVCAAVLLLTSAVFKTSLRKRRSPAISPALGILVAGAIAVFGAYQFYSYAAQTGWLSEAATNKFETQVENVDVPLLVAGRSEVLVYFEAIFDSPLLGHGSWPRDAYYADKLALERYQHGLSGSPTQPIDKSIPIHSHLFGSWIEAGMMGGVFWAYIMFLVAQSIIKSTTGSSPMRPLYLYAAILLFWDVLFSPFSGFRRLETAFLIVVVLRSLLQRGGRARVAMKRLRHRQRFGSQKKRRMRRRKRIEGPGGRQVLGPA